MPRGQPYQRPQQSTYSALQQKLENISQQSLHETSSVGSASPTTKCCYMCDATQTPLWRSGYMFPQLSSTNIYSKLAAHPLLPQYESTLVVLCNKCGISLSRNKEGFMGKVVDETSNKSQSSIPSIAIQQNTNSTVFVVQEWDASREIVLDETFVSDGELENYSSLPGSQP